MLAAGAAPAVYARGVFRPALQPVWCRGGVVRNEALDLRLMYRGFAEQQIRAIAASLGVPYEQLVVDIGLRPYSSSRVILQADASFRIP